MLYVSNMFGVFVSAILLSTLTDVQSRYVRHPEIHRSVVHKKIIATWDEAKRRCEAEGAIMASPLDEEMVEYMRSSIGINNHTTPYFIGFRVTGNLELIFASVEGVPLDDLPEAAINMIEQLDPQDGDCLGMGRHNIRVVSCRARLPYICYKNDSSTPTTVVPVDVTTDAEPEVTTETDDRCSEGYTYLQVSGSYYKMHNVRASWDVAEQTCAAEGGYLAVINNEDEAQALKELVSNSYIGDFLWVFVGVRDREENGNWRSVLGEPLNQIFHKWSITHTPYYHCGTLKYDGYLDDIVCRTTLPYVCEKQC